jgi:phosphonoacetaldehyde hydrolase
MRKRQIEAVVFDWAGTIVDHGSLAPVYAFQRLFLNYGVQVSEAVIRRDMGMAKKEHLRLLLQTDEVLLFVDTAAEHALPSLDVLYEELLTLQRETIAERAAPFPEMAEVLKFLQSRSIVVGTTTGYPESILQELREVAGQHGLNPEVIISASDVSEGRPAPWMIYRACEALGVYPMSRVVVVDDTVAGVEAALNAGCWAVGVTATGNLTGLDASAFHLLEQSEKDRLLEVGKAAFEAVGAHFVIPSVAALPSVIGAIESLDKSIEGVSKEPAKFLG